MLGTVSSRLLQQVSRIRWLVLTLGILAAVIHQLLEGFVSPSTLPDWRLAELIYGISISILAWLLLSWLGHSIGETEARGQELSQALLALSQANQRLEFMIEVNRRMAGVEDEKALADTMLDLFMEAIPANACSLIRFNDQQQALLVIHHGNLEATALESNASHWSLAEVRRQCEQCAQRWPQGAAACPLFATSLPVTGDGSPDLAEESHSASGLTAVDPSNEAHLHCLELMRGEKVYGILSLYLAGGYTLSDQEHMLLEMMANEMSLALESHALRARELEVIYRLQGARRLSNLHDELTEAMANAVDALDADGGVLFVTEEDSEGLRVQAEVGRPLGPTLTLVEGLARGSGQSETPIIISDLDHAENVAVRSLLIAPLRMNDTVLGSQVLWAAVPNAFTRRRALLMAIVAAQAALLIENHRLYLRGEHEAAIAERARLAREIHDGLAQTLAYLKLRIAQIGGRLKDGDQEYAVAGLDRVRRLLDEVYIDAREAIDGLRLKGGDCSTKTWVKQIVAEFEGLSNVPVETTFLSDVMLAIEVQAQLQRIVQETFSNIRKHADATRVWLQADLEDQTLTLQISDNGHGFDPDGVAPIARHGLRIMKERAELIGADLRITSRLDGGTRVTIRLPGVCPASEV